MWIWKDVYYTFTLVSRVWLFMSLSFHMKNLWVFCIKFVHHIYNLFWCNVQKIALYWFYHVGLAHFWCHQCDLVDYATNLLYSIGLTRVRLQELGVTRLRRWKTSITQLKLFCKYMLLNCLKVQRDWFWLNQMRNIELLNKCKT